MEIDSKGNSRNKKNDINGIDFNGYLRRLGMVEKRINDFEVRSIETS